MSAPELSMARAYLAALTGEADPIVTFQTFDDAAAKAHPDPLAHVLHGTFDQHAAELMKLNEKGAGVFVMVNEGDGKGRRAENVTRIRAAFVDHDTPDTRPLAMTPSFSVTTSPGKRHDYLCVEGDLPLEQFKPLQKVLIEHCGSDPGVNDLPRVMRVPGFYHRKGEPRLVTFEPGSGQTHTLEEILGAHEKAWETVATETATTTTATAATVTIPGPAVSTSTSTSTGGFDVVANPTRRDKLVRIARDKAAERNWTEGNRHASATATAAHARKLGLDAEEIFQIVADFIERAGKTREEAKDIVEWTLASVAPDPAEADMGRSRYIGHVSEGSAHETEIERYFRSPSEVLHTRKPRKPISTGIERLDEHTGGGLSPGDSAIFGSGPGGLKTTLFVNIVETMSRPDTAICFLAWDERETTVAAKLGARFGEDYSTLDSEHPGALESLTGRLDGRGAFVRFVDPASMMPFEDIAETFDRIAPPGRTRIYVVDLLQLMESRTISDGDTEVTELKKIVEALLRVNRLQESILLVASESTKAAISLEAVEANPLGIFAGSRKMASRFDLPVAMAKTDDVTVKVFVAKNRLGPAGTFLMRLDPATWRVESLSEDEARADADSVVVRKRKALGKEILHVLPLASLPGMSRRRIQDALRARNVRFRASDIGPAIELLSRDGFVVQNDGARGSLLANLAIGVNPEGPQVQAW